jgi:FixJ family two-component response regulator
MEPMSLTARPENAPNESIVFVVDDDDSVRAALKELLESVGLKVVLFKLAAEFLESTLPDTNSCLVLDVRMPAMSGLKLQEELAKADVHVPIVFITGHGSISMAARAMKAGAVDFLEKPFTDQDLLDAVFAALERDRARRNQAESVSSLRDRFHSLSAREREVLSHVAAGRLNKQIAADLGVSEVMVKVHRARGTRKMRAKSMAELVRMIDLVQAVHAPLSKTGARAPLEFDVVLAQKSRGIG